MQGHAPVINTHAHELTVHDRPGCCAHALDVALVGRLRVQHPVTENIAWMLWLIHMCMPAGYSHITGGYPGGQAQYARVLWGEACLHPHIPPLCEGPHVDSSKPVTGRALIIHHHAGG